MVAMPDGAVLLADVYHPVGVDAAPTILERTPYGRHDGVADGRGAFAAARLPLRAAGRPRHRRLRRERELLRRARRRRATADWIAEQPWFDGNLGIVRRELHGLHPVGARVDRAAVPQGDGRRAVASVRSFSWYPGDALALELMIQWDLGARATSQPRARQAPRRLARGDRRGSMQSCRKAFDHLPMGDVHPARHRRGPPAVPRTARAPAATTRYWAPFDFTGLLDGWTCRPCSSTAGTTTRSRACATTTPRSATRARPVRLRIGGGGHLDGGGEGGSDRGAARLVRHAPPRRPESRAGARRSGPRAGRRRRSGTTRRLAAATRPDRVVTSTPTAGSPSRPRRRRLPLQTVPYDPADPTPSVGGIGLFTGGMVDNPELEARDDVLVYTSAPLDDPLEMSGRCTAELVSSRRPRPHRLLRARLRRPSRRQSLQRVRRAAAVRPPTRSTRADDGTFKGARPRCGRPPTASAPATACGCRCRAARIPCTCATSGPTSPSPPPPSWSPTTRPCTTTSGTRATSPFHTCPDRDERPGMSPGRSSPSPPRTARSAPTIERIADRPTVTA